MAENEPVSLIVPIYGFDECDLIGALEFVVRAYLDKHDGDTIEAQRAVNWLHSKYCAHGGGDGG